MRPGLCFISTLVFLSALQLPSGSENASGTFSTKSNKQLIANNYGRKQANIRLSQAQRPAAPPAAGPKPEIKSAQPQEVPVEEKLTLSGVNFSVKPSDNTVTIGDKKAQVQSATATSIVVTVPKDAKPGKQKVIVSVGSAKSDPTEVTVLGPPPELTSLSLSSGPPGSPLTISGKNFSTVARDNKVTIGGAQAEVDSASQGSLSVTIPTIESPQYGVQVSVQVGKQKSKNSLSIDIQSREY